MRAQQELNPVSKGKKKKEREKTQYAMVLLGCHFPQG